MDRRFRYVPIAATAACLVGFGGGHLAHAEPSLSDKAMETELFKEGRGLLDQGEVSAACRKLTESQRLDPGGGTLLNLALCHEREGRTASAWVEFTEALGLAKRDDRPQRVEFARTHIAQIEPLLSRIVIEVPPAADLPELEVRRDGDGVARAAWGSPVPVDPGVHVVEAVGPGRTGWRQIVVVGPKADIKTVVIPTLESGPIVAPAASTIPVTAAAADLSEPRASTPSPGTGAIQKTPAVASAGSSGLVIAGWSTVVLGAAGAGLGTYFALHAAALKNDADRACANDICTVAGADSNRSAIQSANLATASLAVGGAALLTGAILVAVGGHAASEPASGARPSSAVAWEVHAGPSARGGGADANVTLSGRW